MCDEGRKTLNIRLSYDHRLCLDSSFFVFPRESAKGIRLEEYRF